MSVLYIDGFETYGNTVNAVTTTDVVGNRWIAVSESSMKIQTGRTGGYSIDFTAFTCKAIKSDLNTTNATLVIGCGINVNTVSGDQFFPIWMRTDDTWGVNVAINTDGKVAVRRYTTTLGTSANSVISANTWHYLELKVLVSNSVGTYEVWVDGTSVLSGSGVDTQAHASKTYHNGFQLRGGTLSQSVRFDDLYVLDGAGASNNDRLGAKIVSIIRPDGDDTTQWTAQGAGSHYVEIDEVVFDDDTTYIESSVAAQQDIFTYGNVASTANIKCVQVTTECKETDADSYELKTLAKSTGNTVNGTVQFVGTTDWAAKSVVFETDPDGAGWTQNTVNATKFGVEVV